MRIRLAFLLSVLLSTFVIAFDEGPFDEGPKWTIVGAKGKHLHPHTGSSSNHPATSSPISRTQEIEIIRNHLKPGMIVWARTKVLINVSLNWWETKDSLLTCLPQKGDPTTDRVQHPGIFVGYFWTNSNKRELKARVAFISHNPFGERDFPCSEIQSLVKCKVNLLERG